MANVWIVIDEKGSKAKSSLEAHVDKDIFLTVHRNCPQNPILKLQLILDVDDNRSCLRIYTQGQMLVEKYVSDLKIDIS